MDSASQEQRLKWYFQEQYRPKWALHFPSDGGYILIILILMDQLGLLGTNSINAPRQ